MLRLIYVLTRKDGKEIIFFAKGSVRVLNVCGFGLVRVWLFYSVSVLVRLGFCQILHVLYSSVHLLSQVFKIYLLYLFIHLYLRDCRLRLFVITLETVHF